MTDTQHTHSPESVTQPESLKQWILNHLPGPDGKSFFSVIVKSFCSQHGMVNDEKIKSTVWDQLKVLEKQKLIKIGSHPDTELFWHKV